MINFNTPDDLTIWSFDPGKTTGFAKWGDASLQMIGEINSEEIFQWLETAGEGLKPNDIVIIENYRVRPTKVTAHYWNSMLPSTLIGAIDYWAFLGGARTVLQEPSIKPVGYGRMKKTANKGNNNHAWDAVAHLVYYLMRNYE